MTAISIKFLVAGFFFGAIIQYAGINKNDTISGMASRDNFTIAKAIALALGLGAILLNIEVGLGWADYHVIPFQLVGITVGGLFFGTGMAILGYCPGTLPISLGQGSLDALIGIIGGLIASVVYTIYAPFFISIIGPDLGKLSLNSVMGSGLLFYITVFILGGLFIGTAFWIQKIEKTKNYKWIVSGIGLGVLFSACFSHIALDNVVGASTAFIFIGDKIFGATQYDFYQKWAVPGKIQSFFLLGALIAGFVFSVRKREFKLTLIYNNWAKYKGTSKTKRIVWAFIGGFILCIGARMAGGCTSGHIISGGIQFAFSSLVFAMFVFIGLLITGKLFYRK